jgi:hypothetical protein
LRAGYFVAALEQWSCVVVVIQGNSESEAAHFLFVLIKNIELSVDAIVFSDQVQQRHFDVT